MSEKYKITGDYVLYGGPKNYSDDFVVCRNLSPLIAIRKISELTGEQEDNISLFKIYKTKEDSMGCYHRYRITKDMSVDTIWSNLSAKERFDLFDYADSWMQNEMCEIPEVAGKIESFTMA